MNKKLYIIGNGFDLHHGLKTGYYDFAEYLEKTVSHLHNLLESHISYPQTDDELWARFEENLANLDIDSIIDDNSNYLPDVASDEFRDRDLHAFPDVMDGIFKNLTEDLIANFKKFILQVEIPNSAFEVKVAIDKTAHFFSFNYTNTLEQLYDVSGKQILYIHNSVHDKYVNIVLGHGIDPETFIEKEPEPPNGLSFEELHEWHEQQNDNGDYSFDTGKENIMRYFLQSFKPTAEIILKNDTYFKSLSEIEEVFVFGHSLSGIDMPYFEEIVKYVNPNAKWTVSYYDEKEKDPRLKSLLELGIKEANINLVELRDLQLNNNQLKIPFA